MELIDLAYVQGHLSYARRYLQGYRRRLNPLSPQYETQQQLIHDIIAGLDALTERLFTQK